MNDCWIIAKAGHQNQFELWLVTPQIAQWDDWNVMSDQGRWDRKSLELITRWSTIFRTTVCDDIDRRFDNLSGCHRHSQVISATSVDALNSPAIDLCGQRSPYVGRLLEDSCCCWLRRLSKQWSVHFDPYVVSQLSVVILLVKPEGSCMFFWRDRSLLVFARVWQVSLALASSLSRFCNLSVNRVQKCYWPSLVTCRIPSSLIRTTCISWCNGVN